MFKKFFLPLLLFLIVLPKSVIAFKAETFVSMVNFVQGDSSDLLEKIKITYQSSTHSAVLNDWLVDSRILNNASVSGYLKDLSKADNQKFGLFIDTSDQLIDKLSTNQRQTLLNQVFDSFFNIFGTYPKFISSKVIDTASLQYLQEKYSIMSFVFLPQQSPQLPSETGGYQLAPYIASKNNYFLPSSSSQNRLPVVISEATYLSANFLLPRLEMVDDKKFNNFGQVTFFQNIEESSTKTLSDLKTIYHTLKSNSDKFSLNQKHLEDFADWYLARYPESTPAFYYKIDNDFVYQSPWYRFNFKLSDRNLLPTKLTIYNQKFADPSLVVPNPGLSGLQTLPSIDLNSFYNGQPTSLTDNLYFSHLKNFDYWKMSLKNQDQEIVLDPQKIEFININIKSPNSDLISVTNSKSKTTWTPINTKNQNYFFLILLLAVFSIYLMLKKKPPKHLILGLVFVITANLINFRSGQSFSFGLAFWGPHGHDSLFHLSLIESFSQNPFSLSHPQIIGQKIANYHLFFDYVSGILVKFTGVSALDYYFRIFPLFAGLLIVFLLDNLLTKLNLSSLQKSLSFLFVFFGSSLGFLVRLLQHHDFLTGESAFWANQSLSMFLNPPFLLSIIFLLWFLNLYSKQNKVKGEYLLLVLLGGLLSQVKIYGFILLILSLILNKEYLLGVSSGLVGLLISLPFTKFGNSPFAFSPLWFPKTMFESADRVYSQNLASAWQVFTVNGQMSKILLLSFFSTAIFLVGNLGFRIFGLFNLIKNESQNKLDQLIRWLIFLSLVLPLVVTQTVNPWNSIQFLYYGLFFLGIYLAKSLPKNVFLSFVVTFFAVFGSVGTLRDYLTSTSSSRVSHQEILGLNLLKKQTKGVVVSPLFAQKSTLFAPVPLYDYTSTAYISALSGQPEYLSDTVNLDITGLDYQEKKKNLQRFYNTTDQIWAKSFLTQNNILYVYETPLSKLKLNPEELGLVPIYLSPETNIYKTAH